MFLLTVRMMKHVGYCCVFWLYDLSMREKKHASYCCVFCSMTNLRIFSCGSVVCRFYAFNCICIQKTSMHVTQFFYVCIIRKVLLLCEISFIMPPTVFNFHKNIYYISGVPKDIYCYSPLNSFLSIELKLFFCTFGSPRTQKLQ